MDLEQKILQALGQYSQSTEELTERLVSFDSGVSRDDIGKALFQLREQKSWIVKHPVIGGGCKTCACSVSYVWRLSISGRQELARLQEENKNG